MNTKNIDFLNENLELNDVVALSFEKNCHVSEAERQSRRLRSHEKVRKIHKKWLR
jgi:hypothetical protein